MPRPRNTESSVPLQLKLPESERARIDLLLWSEAEERVPQGAYLRFFRSVLALFFETRELDLAPYLGCLPGERTVRGTPATLAALETTLRGQSRPDLI